jgi:hypothetical protein
MTKPLEFGTYEIKGIMEIHNSAIDAIISYLYDKGFDTYTFEREVLPQVGKIWVEKRGTWPKRVAKRLKILKIHIENNDLAMIGKIARESCITGEDYLLHVVNHFNWNGGYGDGGSCYWNSKQDAKRMILDAGGGALLLHTPNQEKIARCWWVPWNEHLILFNGYTINGDNMSLTSFSRMVMDLTERTYYRKIGLNNRGTAEGLLWINSCMGFLIGDQTIQDTVEVQLDLLPYCCKCGEKFTEEENVRDYKSYCDKCHNNYHKSLRCYDCGDTIYDEDAYYSDITDHHYCEECYNNTFFCCDSCGNDGFSDSGHIVNSTWYCEHCFKEYFVECHECGHIIHRDDADFGSHDIFYCESCRDRLFIICDQCEEEDWKSDTYRDEDGKNYCYNCTRIIFAKCHQCREWVRKTDIYTMAWGNVCSECVIEEVA